MTLTIIQAIIFISYVTFLMIKFKGPLPSISDSWYELDGLYKSLFTWFCWGLGFLMLFQTDGTSAMFFLSGAGLCFVGAATMFKESMTKTVHFTGAAIGIISALIGIWIERGSNIPLIIWLIFCVLFEISKVPNKTWWIEIIAFFAIIFGLICF